MADFCVWITIRVYKVLQKLLTRVYVKNKFKKTKKKKENNKKITFPEILGHKIKKDGSYYLYTLLTEKFVSYR